MLNCLKSISFILAFLLHFVANAQVFDSARMALKTDPGFDLVWGSRFSFFQNQPAVVQSVGLGFNFNKKISFGLCYHWISNIIKVEKSFDNPKTKKVENIDTKLYFRYISIYGDLLYHKTKRWKFNIPIFAGMGSDFFRSTNKEKPFRTPIQYFLIYEPAVHVQFKIIRWFGLGANIGFRFIGQKEKFITNQFNSPTYAFGIHISWDELTKDLFPENKYVKKLGPKAW